MNGNAKQICEETYLFSFIMYLLQRPCCSKALQMFILNIIGKILFPNDLAGNRLKSLKRRKVVNKHNIRLRFTTTCYLFNFVWLTTCWCKIIRFIYIYIYTERFHLTIWYIFNVLASMKETNRAKVLFQRKRQIYPKHNEM